MILEIAYARPTYTRYNTYKARAMGEATKEKTAWFRVIAALLCCGGEATKKALLRWDDKVTKSPDEWTTFNHDGVVYLSRKSGLNIWTPTVYGVKRFVKAILWGVAHNKMTYFHDFVRAVTFLANHDVDTDEIVNAYHLALGREGLKLTDTEMTVLKALGF
jgi:hypothetical protein